MRHRVFIAINLPEDVKEELASYQSKWLELPCRWTKKDNLHITLEFLGYVSDQELLEICEIAKKTAQKHTSFEIKLDKIIYGPPKKIPPRMVWIEGEKSKELGDLKDDLAKSLGYNPEKGTYSPHITLGRIKTWEFKTIEPEERPEVSEDIDLTFEVNSIEVMESVLKKGGSEYTVLESCPLKS